MSGIRYRKQRSLAKDGAKSTALVVTCVGLNWVGNASSRAVNFFEYSWVEPLSFSTLVSDMLALPRVDLISTIRSGLLVPYLNSVMLLGAVAVVVATLAFSRTTLWLLNAAVVVSLPYGVLGLMAIPVNVDVEYFSEGWSLLFAHTLWTVVLGMYAVRLNGHMARTPVFANVMARAHPDAMPASQSSGLHPSQQA